MGLLHRQGCSVVMLSARRCKLLGPGLRGEEQFLQVRLGHPLQSPPFLNGKEHSSFYPSLGHYLCPFGDGGVEKLAEPRLGVLNRPFLAHTSPRFPIV